MNSPSDPPLSILVVTTLYGDEVRSSPLANMLVPALVARGHKVDVAVLGWSAPEGRAPRLESTDGLRVLRLFARRPRGLPGLVGKLAKWVAAPFASRRGIAAGFGDARYDLMIGFSIASALLGPFSWALPRARRTYLYINDFFPFHHRSIGSIPSGPVFHLARLIETGAMRRFDVVACMSPAGVDYLRGHYRLRPEQRVEILPLWNRIDPPPPAAGGEVRRSHGLPLGRPIALFGGHIAEGRGIEELLAAAAHARTAAPDLFFLVVGSGPLVHLVRRAIAEGGGNLAHIEAIAHDRYLSLAAACDIGVVATVADVDVPTFPSKTLDYLRAGLPVAASVERSTDYADFVREHGFGIAVEAGSAERLLGAIRAIAEDPQAAARMKTAGQRTLVEIFDVERAVDRIIRQSGLSVPAE